MSDLIRREDAIAAATSCPDSHWGPWIAERLRALPAVQPDALIAERDEALECNEAFFVDNQILRERVEEIRKEWEGWQSAAVKLMEKVTALTVERDRFRVALQLYAEPCDATETSPCGYEGNMCCRTARAALKGESHE